MRAIHLTVLVLVLWTDLSGGRTGVPSSPCPQLFQYYRRADDQIYGVLFIDNQRSSVYDLEINMTIPIQTKNNIEIRRITDNTQIQLGSSIEYQVHFPYQESVPRLTSIFFNGNLLCYGPRDEAPIVTSLSRRNILRVGPVDKLSARPPPSPNPSFNNPFINNFNNFNLNTVPPPSEPPVLETNINIPGSQCGETIGYQPLIFSGKPTHSGEFPWLVAMFYLAEKAYAFRCSGSLVSERHVVTAAHCLKMPDKAISTEEVLMVLGKHNLKNWAAKSTIVSASRFIIHPDYKTVGDADIAVIVLERTVQYSPTIKPLCLWEENTGLDSIIGHDGIVTGWGRDESGKDTVDEPLQIKIPVVSQETCLRSDSRFFKITSSRTFCAGRRDGAIPCTGDSGGPFFMQRNGRWVLRGVVSAALVNSETRLCDSSNYVVFSDVPKYRKWLNKAMELL
ncbi:PREDICTED: serine protease gd-like [Nicrophorus vespilloides]|uniref:Serine protease gd-like n=1 Tax=Nicrophorus vespilloides TaxID=110193 RepID=A0ABM1MQ78_NICVS|nr:PREDICTED: serine protease gd-like [Nicrophorus vespilloides]